MIDIFGIIPNWSDRVKQNPSRTHEVEAQVSNEKRAPGCLGYIGDETLSGYMGILISHYKDPY